MNTKDIRLPSKKDTMDIARNEMPQVASKDISDFIRYITKNNISVAKKSIDPDGLKATQGQFHKKKIADLLDVIKKDNYKQKPIIVSKDMYVLDGHHRWLAHVNAEKDIEIYHIDLSIDTLLDKMKEYPKSFTQKLYECLDLLSEDDSCPLITPKQMKSFEKVVDKLFGKFDIDFNFTKHFRERMSDTRNDPCISLKELATTIQKIYKRQGKSIKGIAGAEAVVKDIQTDLNIPVAVKYDSKNDEFDVVMKTIMRKKNFRTPDKVITY